MKKDKHIILKIPKSTYELIKKDLDRSHPFAFERVGFLSTKMTRADEDFVVVTATGYTPIEDDDYIDDEEVGAKINEHSIHQAMRKILSSQHGCLHVHLHKHKGPTHPSFTDLSSLPQVAKAFHNANPETACGYLILSEDSFFCNMSVTSEFKLSPVSQVSVVGSPMAFSFFGKYPHRKSEITFDRQSFLGEQSQTLFRKVRIGLVGLGGGGSHVAQQLAHLGFANFTIFDHDHIEESNLNRLIGAWYSDIKIKLKKTAIAERMIKKVHPKATVNSYQCRWQDDLSALQKCDIVVSSVDSYLERSQLEAACRAVLTPMIDIGMDVHNIPDFGNAIAGQVILSMPGQACMRCMKFLTEEKLKIEANRYGNTGGRPQVVWPNGVLASTAVGITVDLITGWANKKNAETYLCYDGNSGHISGYLGAEYWPKSCHHFLLENTGSAIFKKL